MVLKSIIGDTLPIGTTFVLVGNPGSGKTSIALSVAQSYIESDKHVIYLTTENTPNRLLELYEKLGVRFEESKRETLLSFIDAYSWKIGAKSDRLAKAMISNPGNFSEVSLAINNLTKGLPEGSLVVLDSLSGLMLSAPEESRIKNFFHVLSQRLNQQGFTLMAIIENNCHDKKLILSLRALANCSIIIRKNNHGSGRITRTIRVTEMLGSSIDTRWKNIILSVNGLALGE